LSQNLTFSANRDMSRAKKSCHKIWQKAWHGL